jgi:flagellar protein FliO/FliZ
MDTLFVALRVALSLAAVLGLIWYVQRRISRGGKARRDKPIAIVGRQGVGSKASVAVVDVDGKRFLLGVTDHAVTVLHTSDAPVAPVPAETFSRVLADETAGSELATPVAARPVTPSPLGGSLLSADTWRRAFASLRS